MSSSPLLPQVPVYLKTADDMPRPREAEFFWITRSGTYLCRNHPFFQSDVPARRMPSSLASHRTVCRLKFPLLGVAALEHVVGFFDEVFRRHGSEAIVLVLWDLRRKRYRLCVPPQQATVWESQSGLPTPMDVSYQVSAALPPQHLLIGDIHSHADMQAYSSGIDTHDERYRDGIHAVVGRVDREPPEFHLEMSVDGCRFALQFGHFFQGYRARRRRFPKSWLEQVEIKTSRMTWTNTYNPVGSPAFHASKPSLPSAPKPRYPGWDGQA
jgi:hypothetical protein